MEQHCNVYTASNFSTQSLETTFVNFEDIQVWSSTSDILGNLSSFKNKKGCMVHVSSSDTILAMENEKLNVHDNRPCWPNKQDSSNKCRPIKWKLGKIENNNRLQDSATFSLDLALDNHLNLMLLHVDVCRTWQLVIISFLYYYFHLFWL